MQLQGELRVGVWDLEHGACAMVQQVNGKYSGRLATIDSGCTAGWRPSSYITRDLGRNRLDYLFINKLLEATGQQG